MWLWTEDGAREGGQATAERDSIRTSITSESPKIQNISKRRSINCVVYCWRSLLVQHSSLSPQHSSLLLQYLSLLLQHSFLFSQYFYEASNLLIIEVVGC